ncbi:hypothetical protein [Hydrocarboniphaga sp.]|uniref:hypothetical protein n=1 Tax=Hydrocarboniphaga sp. TaxID=2033016 RepID=UPI003D0B2F65
METKDQALADLRALLGDDAGDNAPTFAGETIALSPMRAAALAQALELCEPLMSDAPTLVTLVGDGEIDLNMTRLMARHATRVLKFCALATGKPQPWVDDLPGPDLFRLFVCCIRGNPDFFALVLGPAAQQAASLVEGFRSSSRSTTTSPAEPPSPAPDTGSTPSSS